MPITFEALQTALTNAFPQASVTITDLAGDNDHWSTTITCATFSGKSRIAQHRMVQEAVKDHDIHALQITTKTP